MSPSKRGRARDPPMDPPITAEQKARLEQLQSFTVAVTAADALKDRNSEPISKYAPCNVLCPASSEASVSVLVHAAHFSKACPWYPGRWAAVDLTPWLTRAADVPAGGSRLATVPLPTGG